MILISQLVKGDDYMKMKFVCSIVIAFAIIAACSKTKEYPQLSYKYVAHNFQYGNCDTIDFECVEIKIKTVELSADTSPGIKDSIEKKVNNFILSATIGETGYNSLEELRDSLFENYKAIRIEIPDMRIGYGLERNVKIETDTLGILAMEFFEYTFYGGAHPNSSTTFSNINLENGKEINIDEILIDGFEDEINKIGERIFRQAKQLKPDEDLQEAGFWFEGSVFKLNDNFIITKTGLKFFLNPYEIAPYAYGTTEIFINYSDLKNLIKIGEPLERFLK